MPRHICTSDPDPYPGLQLQNFMILCKMTILICALMCRPTGDFKKEARNRADFLTGIQATPYNLHNVRNNRPIRRRSQGIVTL